MKKILLIFPKTGPDFLEPPFGLISLGTTLRASGYEVEILDCRLTSFSKFISTKTKNEYLFVGLTIMTGPQIGFARRVASELRTREMGPLVWGGVHATILPDQTIADEFVDYVLTGYADRTVVLLAESFSKGNFFPKEIDGLYYKKDGLVISNKKISSPRLQELPIPDWTLVDVKKYVNRIFTGKDSIYLFTSRGCPHSCTFCYGISFHGKKWQGRPAEQVILELENISKMTNYDVVFFHDDNFSASHARIEKIVGYLKQMNKKYVLSSNAVDLNDSLLELFARSGCIRLDVSIESGSDKILSLYNKGFTVSEIKKILAKAHALNLPINVAFIIGHPKETNDDLLKTLDLVDFIRLNYPEDQILDLKILTPYPGTPIFEEAIKLGLKPPTKLADWSDYYWNTLGPWRDKSWHLIDLSFWSLFYLRNNHLGHVKFPLSVGIKLMFFISRWRWNNRYWKYPLDSRLAHFALKLYNYFA